MPNSNYSMCLTSCNRHDLLRQTLESFYLVVDIEPQEVLIYEDSDQPMPEWLTGDIWRSRNVRWISGKTRMGQAFACARLIQESKYEFVFWCECDWLFQRQQSPFISESKQILQSNPKVVCVTVRGQTGWHPLVKNEAFPGLIAEPYWRGCWGGWTWNPGLRRRETLQKLLPTILSFVGVKGLDHEGALSKKLLDQGYRIVDLGRPVVSHIGGGRSRAIEDLPPLPKILIAIPTCFRFDYESHTMKDDPAKTGFHQSGANDQTQAVRETWGRDVAPFKNVDLRFFYGKPAEGFPRQPLPDEIFLDVPDGYDSLIAKTVAVCEWAVREGYQFIFKADTDTFVFVENLLVEIMENHFDYAGFRHANVCSGGPGYLLSRHAAEIVATQGRQPRHEYAEDVHVSRVLAEKGIVPLMLPGHKSGMTAHFFFNNGFTPTLLSEGVVSLHAVFPREMRECYEYVRNRLADNG